MRASAGVVIITPGPFVDNADWMLSGLGRGASLRNPRTATMGLWDPAQVVI
jgi:hypothetical protein